MVLFNCISHVKMFKNKLFSWFKYNCTFEEKSNLAASHEQSSLWKTYLITCHERNPRLPVRKQHVITFFSAKLKYIYKNRTRGKFSLQHAPSPWLKSGEAPWELIVWYLQEEAWHPTAIGEMETVSTTCHCHCCLELSEGEHRRITPVVESNEAGRWIIKRYRRT